MFTNTVQNDLAQNPPSSQQWPRLTLAHHRCATAVLLTNLSSGTHRAWGALRGELSFIHNLQQNLGFKDFERAKELTWKQASSKRWGELSSTTAIYYE